MTRHHPRSPLFPNPPRSRSERGADPASILVVTFTTDAARALRQQVGQELDALAGDLPISTLHAFGRKVIATWAGQLGFGERDRKSTRLNSSHANISYAVFCL